MSSEKEGEPSSAETGFVCGIEASALLNCVASKQYSEAKCKPLLQKLRACIEKKARMSISCHSILQYVAPYSLADLRAESRQV